MVKSDRPEGALVWCDPTAPAVVFVCLKVNVVWSALIKKDGTPTPQNPNHTTAPSLAGTPT